LSELNRVLKINARRKYYGGWDIYDKGDDKKKRARLERTLRKRVDRIAIAEMLRD
jgi:hypothetical protein